MLAFLEFLLLLAWLSVKCGGKTSFLPCERLFWATDHLYGGFEVDLEWRAGQLQSATVRSLGENHCVLRLKSKLVELGLKVQPCEVWERITAFCASNQNSLNSV